MQLRIIRPSLVLLIGPSGSGKSTFARRHFRKTEVVSSDACRALICDDEADQSATKDAFELLQSILKKRLSRGKLTVVDATNVQAWARASLLVIARECDVPCAAIVFDLPPEVCAAHNQARRGRIVATDVIEQQSRDLRATLQELPAEGVSPVHLLRTPQEVDTAVICYEN
ncbi:MAG: AAA family ATPase [Bryobacteraceae bacterium]